MRVLFLTPAYAPAYRLGGPIRSLEQLAAGLVACGVSVEVLTTDSHGEERLDVPRFAVADGVTVQYLRRWLAPDVTPSFLPAAVRRLASADVAHVTGIFSPVTLQALAAADLVGCPTLLSARGALQSSALKHRSERKKRIFLRAAGPLLRRVACWHATSAEESDRIRELFPTARVAIVPNGTPLPASCHRVPHEGMVVGAMGRIHPIKAFERLLEAIAGLNAHPVRLRIAGPIADPPYAAWLRRRAVELGVDGRVSWEGELQGVAKARFFEELDVFAISSLSENFGNVVAEAMSYELPVIASRGTPWTVLETAGAGHWVPGEPADFARAIIGYLQDEAARASAGRRARRLVAERFSIEATTAQMLDAYRSLQKDRQVSWWR